MLIIIEFQPAGLYTFTGINQKELVDQMLPFELINARLNHKITEGIANSHSIVELITKLDQALLASLLLSYPSELQLATKLINETSGNISNKELSKAVYYSDRHLNRIFDQYLGMNIKSFSRLVRINKTIRLMRNPQNSITFSCDFTGYYDVSHFIHDFKSVCGLTPQEYLSSMSDFYSEIAKF
jgi:AraC-like DNA-binding protein